MFRFNHNIPPTGVARPIRRGCMRRGHGRQYLSRKEWGCLVGKPPQRLAGTACNANDPLVRVATK
jgi:hypothetical protein